MLAFLEFTEVLAGHFISITMLKNNLDCSNNYMVLSFGSL